MPTITTTVEVIPKNENLEPFEVEVDWTFSKLDPGVTSGPPENCYPPEGGELEECTLTLPTGTVIDDGESWLRDMIGPEAYEWAEEQAFSDEAGY